MRIEPLSLTLRQLCEGYADHAEDGVVAYGGHTMPDNLRMLCRTCNLKKGNV